jgi:hypothetical protein
MKWVKGYEQLYKVDKTGLVLSYYSNPPKLLEIQTHRQGYKQVGLYKNGKTKHKLLHRLVAEAHLPNPDNLPFINHIDFDKSHNYVSNLEWCNQKANVMHSVNNSKHGATKLSNKNVVLIWKMLKVGIPERIIAEFFKTTQPNIHAIKTGKTWGHITSKIKMTLEDVV